MLFIKVFNFGKHVDSFLLALAGVAIAFYYAAPWENLSAERTEIFTGMLVYDGFTVFIRSVLLIFAFAFIIFTRLSGIPDREDGADIYSLVLGATLGMCLMASTNHLMMLFMSVEMASVPSYALAGMMKGRRQSSEAALKYSVYGAGTAGVMLYGISLIAGLLNTAHFPTLAIRLAEQLPTMSSGSLMVLALGGLMLAVGLAFKLSAVPFHFWCPDVFEGAAAEVNAFLSVASKAGALALLVRVAIGFGAFAPGSPATIAHLERQEAAAATIAANDSTPANFVVANAAEEPKSEEKAADSKASETPAAKTPVATIQDLAPARNFMAKVIAFLAIITCTFGNLAAYGQTNIKRLFAYSTIAHAGYMMMAVPAILAAIGHANGTLAARDAVAGLSIYIGTYVAMNLGAFAIIAFLRNTMRSEEISDYAGLIKSCPLVVICFCVILFSLVGLPPLAGFWGKFAVFASLVESYKVASDDGQSAGYLMWLLVFGGLNTAISLFYYLRIVKVMTIDGESRERPPFAHPVGILPNSFVLLVTVPTAIWMLCGEYLAKWSASAASHLF
jgi:NADH-quinone oxidoreductase subunit N